MTTNDILAMSPDMLGCGKTDNSYFTNQNQSSEGAAELADYIRITKNYDPVIINLLLNGEGFIPENDKQRFNELYPIFGKSKEELLGVNCSSLEDDDLSKWDWDLYLESRKYWIEEMKVNEANEEEMKLNEDQNASPEVKQSMSPNKGNTSKKPKRIQVKKQSYSEYDKIMAEQGKKGFDYMYEKESGFLRLRDEVLDKLLTEKFNIGAIKAYLYIWKMAYKFKYNSLHWTASTNEISKELNLSPNTVSTGLEQLEKRGLIKIEAARHERSSLTYIIQPINH